MSAVEHRLDATAAQPMTPEAAFAAIVADAAAARGLTSAQVLGRDRGHHVAATRHLVCLVAREATALTLPAIGRLLGGRDHTSVRSGLKRAERLCADDPGFADLAAALLAAAQQRKTS